MEALQPARAHHMFTASPHPPARSHLQATGPSSGGEGDENRQQSPRGVAVRLLAQTIRLSPV